jgi:hypothetical protein
MLRSSEAPSPGGVGSVQKTVAKNLKPGWSNFGTADGESYSSPKVIPGS